MGGHQRQCRNVSANTAPGNGATQAECTYQQDCLHCHQKNFAASTSLSYPGLDSSSSYQDSSSFISTPASSFAPSQANNNFAPESPYPVQDSNHIWNTPSSPSLPVPNDFGFPTSSFDHQTEATLLYAGIPPIVDSINYPNPLSAMAVGPSVSPQPQQFEVFSVRSTPDTEDSGRRAVQTWAAHQIKLGLNPFTRPYNRTDVADILDVPLALFSHTIGAMEQTMSGAPYASRVPSQDSLGQCVTSEGLRQMFKQQLAEQFIKDARQGCDSYRTSTPAAGDSAYKCIHHKCSSSHKRADDWKRHCLRAWPTEVFVCDLCLCQDRTKDKVIVTHWKDRLRQHIAKDHKDVLAKESKDDVVSRTLDRSRVHVLDAEHFETTCKYRAAGNRSPCGQRLKGITEALRHYQKHYAPDSLSSSGGSDKESSCSSEHQFVVETGNKRTRASTGNAGKKQRQVK